MKIRLEHGDTAFEMERDPMPPERFKIVCAVLLAVLYTAAVIISLALLGVKSFFILLPVTVAFCGAVYWAVRI